MDFAGYHRGSFIQGSAASALSAASVMFSLLLLGLDIFWLCVATAGLLEGLVKGQMSYSLTWWATIFPVGRLCHFYEPGLGY